MVESIKNMMNRVDIQRSRVADAQTSTASPAKVAKPTAPAGTAENGMVSQKVVAELAKQPPVNSEAVSRIKKAISQGKYPIDVDQITDALMDAYRDLKS
ncbi:MAG TPA: flagellar biosynthesis anti-sigma factor FlgM [Alphaproteobacteria bacterium]|nr:flagellar biosynthesis anti-sigma factor FlgM [Alphaproteobacteria bacterium]